MGSFDAEMEKEVKKNKMDKLVIDTELENEKKAFADKIMSGYGEEISKVYNQVEVIKVKKTFKEKIKTFFNNIKIVLNI